MKEVRARSPIIQFSTSGVRQVLYTCPANCRAKVVLIFIVNANGTTSITFEWYKANTNTHHFIVAGKNFSTGEYLQLSDGYIVLEPGDKLEVTGTGGTVDIDAFCTVEETFIPVG